MAKQRFRRAREAFRRVMRGVFVNGSWRVHRYLDQHIRIDSGEPRTSASQINDGEGIVTRVLVSAAIPQYQQLLPVTDNGALDIRRHAPVCRAKIAASSSSASPPDVEARTIVIDSGLGSSAVIPIRLLQHYDPRFAKEYAISHFLADNNMGELKINGQPLGYACQGITIWLYASVKNGLSLRKDNLRIRLEFSGGVHLFDDRELESPKYSCATLGITAMLENGLSLEVNPNNNERYKLIYTGPGNRIERDEC